MQQSCKHRRGRVREQDVEEQQIESYLSSQVASALIDVHFCRMMMILVQVFLAQHAR
jgi:hypothetical protein